MLTIRNYIAKKIYDYRGAILIVVLVFSMRWSFADHYRVPSGSMIPTIHIGDHLLVNKVAYDIKLPFTDIVLVDTGTPERGEIIVFKYPKDPSVNYVKRLIGLPGDTIEILNGFLKINGKTTLVRSEYFQENLERLYHETSEFSYNEKIEGREFNVQRIPNLTREHYMKFVVPKDMYFFMGDNRDNSRDSREWGFVPREHLKGRVANVTFSMVFDGIFPKIDLSRSGKKLI
ncbi:MAG: signal peptidase I [Oligoflexia bacterium]|nr:signal peptidase I [Oligoflexia bacterium]